MGRILNFGSINIDYVYQLPHIVRPGETLQSQKLVLHPGGKGANQSVALAKSGGEVSHAGKVGKDGHWLIERLERFGVDSKRVLVGEGSTGHAVIQISAEGENAIFLFQGENGQLKREEILKALEKFSQGEWLLVQNETNEVSFLIQEAKKRGLLVCLNPAPYRESVRGYPLESVDLLIVNEVEGQGLTGKGGKRAILESLAATYPAATVVLTLGREGVCCAEGDARIFLGISPSPVVDTTAAGDTFLGYFLARYSRERDVEQALIYATKAAAITVSRPGAMESIPWERELEVMGISDPPRLDSF